MNSPQHPDSDDTPEGLHLLDDYDKEAGYLVQKVAPSRFGMKLPWSSDIGVASMPRSSSYPRHLKRFSFFFAPSFIQNRIQPSSKPKKRMHPTAFLDGMRGLAALLVIVFHLAICCYDTKHGYASGKHGEHREFLKLPFIRIIYAGPTMVSIFFVVSGYALSYKPVKLMRSKNWKDLQQSLASSIFRRAIRLFLPCIVSTFFISILLWLGTYEVGVEYAKSHGAYNVKHGGHERVRFDSFHEQMSYWVSETFGKLINPWTFEAKGTEVTIDGHLWTIPMEFRSSLVLYLSQAGLSLLEPKIRMAIVIFLMFWCHQKTRWEMILFYGGFLCADLDFQRSANAASILPNGTIRSKQRFRRAWSVFYIFLFLLGMYLGCQPQKSAHKTPGWITLSNMIPPHVGKEKRYWPNWGAILMVYSTSNHVWLQRIFINGPVQYLGRISFSMYIMHGVITHTIGYPLMNVMDVAIGREDPINRAIGFIIGAGTTLFFTIWTSDLFMRAVDEPSVKFAKWAEEKCLDKLE